jgi:DNA modification methylase
MQSWLAEKVEHWPVGQLVPYEKNARTHSEKQIDQIAASIREFGFTSPILAGGDHTVVAGHGRLLAARKLGLASVPVVVLDHLTPVQRRALALADNKIAENAGWDFDLVAAELADLQALAVDLSLTGFDAVELKDLLEQEPAEGLTDEDAAPEVREDPVTVRGDVWLLGEHRLLCGDAVVAADIEKLMAGEQAGLVFTDPPYNVAYEGGTEEKLTIQNDDMSPEEFVRFLRDTFISYRMATTAGASLYVCHPSLYQREFQEAIEHAGFNVRCQIIWAKNTFAWGFGRYKFQHEPIFYCHVKGESDAWYGDKSQSTLWQEKKPAANRLHPTMKPVELIERALVNSSKRGDLVLDLFGGSGSTLIAAERMGRRARLLELDPRYCDVIVKRWQEFTGQTAVHAGTGEAFREK